MCHIGTPVRFNCSRTLNNPVIQERDIVSEHLIMQLKLDCETCVFSFSVHPSLLDAAMLISCIFSCLLIYCCTCFWIIGSWFQSDMPRVCRYTGFENNLTDGCYVSNRSIFSIFLVSNMFRYLENNHLFARDVSHLFLAS